MINTSLGGEKEKEEKDKKKENQPATFTVFGLQVLTALLSRSTELAATAT